MEKVELEGRTKSFALQLITFSQFEFLKFEDQMSRPEAQNVSTLEPADLAPAPEPPTVQAEGADRNSKFEIRNSKLIGDEH